MYRNCLKKPKLLLIALTCISTSLLAQNSFNYMALQDDITLKKSLLEETQKRYASDVASLTGNNKKYLADIYKDRFKTVEKFYSDSLVITDVKTEQYLQSILAEIVNNNPLLKNMQMRVLFSRAYWPNAFCSGEGSIFFNIGLFNRLQNESQVAFVLCHELSHQYFNHSNEHIQQYVNTVYSDTFQRRLQQIKKTKYGKRQILEQTVSGISFSSHRHGREHEMQADSMAIEFLKNTHYNVNAAITCLALLDSVDDDKYNVLPRPDSLFNNTAYPFQAGWIKPENGLFSHAVSSELTPEEKDSLKTHPDCSLRIQKLQSRVQQYATSDSKDFIVDDSAGFRQLQQTFDFEIVNYNYHSGSLSRSLYYSMQMLQSYPGNAYLITNIGRCFNKMYTAQKNHVLGTMVDAPSPLTEKKYNTFLQFLQRLRLNDIASINYYFLTSYTAQLSSHADFNKVYSESKQLLNK